MIRFLEHNEIDKDRWDAWIQACPYKTPYARSWYLDLVSPGWAALIDDEGFVMPLPLRRKFGITYVPRPYYAQQLGLFGEEEPGPERISAFLLALPPHIRLADLSLNEKNQPTSMAGLLKLQTNFILQLENSLENLRKNYSENVRRNIRNAAQHSLVCVETKVEEELLHLKWGNKPEKMKQDQLLLAQKIIRTSLGQDSGTIWQAMHPDGEVLASVFFLFDGSRYVYLISASSKRGKEMFAMFLLLDHFIQTRAGSNFVLDFEGSEIPGIARFFAGFGAENHPYPVIRINRLPWFYRMLMK